MTPSHFKIGFWHPFGPHSNEPPAKILERKSREIANAGWTLWSFQFRNMLEVWRRELSGADPVYVFCSSGGGNDPLARGGPAQAVDCKSYQPIGDGVWSDIPAGIRVPHTFPMGKGRASAFVVRRIEYPLTGFDPPSVEWLSRDGDWRQGYETKRGWRSGIPTRGEYLIRNGGNTRMRPVLAILELQSPFLAMVSSDDS